MILPITVVSRLWLVAAVVAADSFPITSPRQTDRSVMLAWETDQEVRTVRNSCQRNPSTPTSPTHDAAIVPGEGRSGSAAARIQGNRSEDNARGCLVQNMEAEHLASRYEYQLFDRIVWVLYRPPSAGEGVTVRFGWTNEQACCPACQNAP